MTEELILIKTNLPGTCDLDYTVEYTVAIPGDIDIVRIGIWITCVLEIDIELTRFVAVIVGHRYLRRYGRIVRTRLPPVDVPGTCRWRVVGIVVVTKVLDVGAIRLLFDLNQEEIELVIRILPETDQHIVGAILITRINDRSICVQLINIECDFDGLLIRSVIAREILSRLARSCRQLNLFSGRCCGITRTRTPRPNIKAIKS